MGTRETVNHMPGMDKSGNIHWIYWWAFATFIPVGITFFLSWYFGAPGGYQPYSLIKLFFAFSANRIRDCILHQTAFIKSDCITVAYDYIFIRAFSYCALFIYTS